MTVTTHLRNAMNKCGETRYGISKATGISEAVLSRFASGETVLSGENIDKLASHLGLELVRKSGRRSARKG